MTKRTALTNNSCVIIYLIKKQMHDILCTLGNIFLLIKNFLYLCRSSKVLWPSG